MGESRTQQAAFSGGLVAAATGFSGAFRVNFVQCCRALWTWVELLCPQFCPHLLACVWNTPASIPDSLSLGAGSRIRDTAGTVSGRSLVFSSGSFPRALFATYRHYTRKTVGVATFHMTVSGAGGGI